MGFDAWFFERIDHEDFEKRKFNGELEMIWRPESYAREKNYLMAHVSYLKYYLAPFEDCITEYCPQYELEAVLQKYAEWIKEQVHSFPTQHIFHQVGGDFEWYACEHRFKMLERLIRLFEENPHYNIKIQFSTPRQYTKAVYKEILEKNITLAEKTNDFFPYRDSPNAFWTGYFTSKPHLKRAIREASTYLQSVKKLLSKLYFQKKLDFSDIDNATHSFEAAL